MCLGGIGILVLIWTTYKFNASILALEDYHLFSADINKPYTKMLAISFALMFIDFYITYQKAKKEDFKNHSMMKRIENSKSFFTTGILLAVGLAFVHL